MPRRPVGGDIDGGEHHPQILDLLPKEEPLARRDDVGDPRGRERGAIPRQHFARGVGPVEDGDVPVRRGAFDAAAIPDLHESDDPPDQRREEIRLVHGKVEPVERDGMPLAGIFPVGHDVRIGGGEVLPAGEDAGEEAGERREQVGAAAEIAGQRDVLSPGVDHPLAELPVHLDVGAAEAVDRLLRIPDDEKAPRDRVGRDRTKNPRLQRIRILELVHEDVAEPLPQPPRDLGVPPEKLARPQQQVHEVEPAPLRRLVLPKGDPGPRDEEARRRVPPGDLGHPFPEPEQPVAHLGQFRRLGAGEFFFARRLAEVQRKGRRPFSRKSGRNREVPAGDRLPGGLEDAERFAEPLRRRVVGGSEDPGDEGAEIVHVAAMFPDEEVEEIRRGPEVGRRPAQQVALEEAEAADHPPRLRGIGKPGEDPLPLGEDLFPAELPLQESAERGVPRVRRRGLRDHLEEGVDPRLRREGAENSGAERVERRHG